MGAWGPGIFDNDDAADWVAELAAGGWGAIEESVRAALAAGYLEAPEGARALAAADVVARLRSGGGETSAYAEGVIAWVERNPGAPPPGLVELARQVLLRVQAEGSELRDLWSEAGDEEWLAGLADLETRLTG